jgi:hypothetical protein
MTGPVGRFGFVYARARGGRLQAGAQCGPRSEGFLDGSALRREDAPCSGEEGEEASGVVAIRDGLGRLDWLFLPSPLKDFCLSGPGRQNACPASCQMADEIASWSERDERVF